MTKKNDEKSHGITKPVIDGINKIKEFESQEKFKYNGLDNQPIIDPKLDEEHDSKDDELWYQTNEELPTKISKERVSRRK